MYICHAHGLSRLLRGDEQSRGNVKTVNLAGLFVCEENTSIKVTCLEITVNERTVHHETQNITVPGSPS